MAHMKARRVLAGALAGVAAILLGFVFPGVPANASTASAVKAEPVVRWHQAPAPGVKAGQALHGSAEPTADPYWIVFFHSGLCVDNPNYSQVAGTQIDQWGCVLQTNLDWYFDFTTNGYARIRNRASGQCLNIKGGSTAAGAPIIQWYCGNYTNEEWKGFYKFTAVDQFGFAHDFYQLQSRHSGLCLNIEGGSLANGARLIQWPCGDYANEYITWF